MKNLPIGIQSFEEMRNKNNNYIYADKTKYIYEIIEERKAKYIFLSRPRRFGKSLFLDTIRCLFEGKKELFSGLFIYDKWRFEIETRPVVRVIFGNGYIDNKEKLKEVLFYNIKTNCLLNNLDENSLIENSPDLRFEELIKAIYKKTGKQVVILVDEYDKPILDKIEDLNVCEEIKEELKGFYSVIKGLDEYLKFVFITGVTKFSKVSVFSGLNNLNDITINPDYNGICGYNLQEVKDNFGKEGYLEGIDLYKMRSYYNGYSFGNLDETVYNPFGLLNFFFNKNDYRNYWFGTATPTFLIKLIKSGKYDFQSIDLESINVGEEILNSFDINNIKLETLLFQSGYLTIKDIKNYGGRKNYSLKVPNEEVRISFNEYLLTDYFLIKDNRLKYNNLEQLYKVLENGNVEGYIEIVKNIFAGIPYSSYTKNDISKYEGFYCSIIYSFMAFTGIEFVSEDFTNRGRIDFTMKLKNKIYIIEIKVEQSGKKALEQIKEKKYFEKYQNVEMFGKNILIQNEIYLIGINFDKDLRNVGEYEWEKIIK